jgi:hypothetical protein
VTSNAARTSDDDLFVLTITGFLALGAAAAAAPLWWAKAITWLLAHQVLLPRAEHPLLTLPCSGGAGLDVPRLAVLVGAVLLLAAAVGALRPYLRAGELQ